MVRDLNLRVLRGDRLGIVGPNGAGKTTILKLLTGELPPDSGEVRIGTSLASVTLDQQRASLDPDTTLADTLTGGGDTVVVAGETPARHRLHEGLPVQARAGPHAGGRALGRRARPAAAGLRVGPVRATC